MIKLCDMEGNVAQFLVAGEFSSAMRILQSNGKLNYAIGFIIIFIMVEGQELFAKFIARRSTEESGVRRHYSDVSLLETALELRAMSLKLGLGIKDEIKRIGEFITDFKNFPLLTIRSADVGHLVTGLRAMKRLINDESVLDLFPLAVKKINLCADGVIEAALFTRGLLEKLRGPRTTAIQDTDGREILTPSVSTVEGEQTCTLVDSTEFDNHNNAQSNMINSLRIRAARSTNPGELEYFDSSTDEDTDGEVELKFCSKVNKDHIRYVEGLSVETGLMKPDGNLSESDNDLEDYDGWSDEKLQKLGRRARLKRKLRKNAKGKFYVETQWGTYETKSEYLRKGKFSRTPEVSGIDHLAEDRLITMRLGGKVKLKPVLRVTKNVFGKEHFKWLKDEDGNFYKYVPEYIEVRKPISLALEMLQDAIPWQPELNYVD